MIKDQIQLRPVEDQDKSLLYQIYANTRVEEMALVTFWTDEQKTIFLTQQFEAQSQHYFSDAYANREYSIILYQNKAAGRLYLDCPDKEIRIVDIALLPEFRGLGIGEYLLRSVLDRAAQKQIPAVIHVEHMNPAKRLYDRLGFKVIQAVNEIYLRMEWIPEVAAS